MGDQGVLPLDLVNSDMDKRLSQGSSFCLNPNSIRIASFERIEVKKPFYSLAFHVLN
jgi:hypothetical protein